MGASSVPLGRSCVVCTPAATLSCELWPHSRLTFLPPRKSSFGWLFICIFALCRLTCAAVQLATLQWPGNFRLYVAVEILTNVGISRLILAIMSMLLAVHRSMGTRAGQRLLPTGLNMLGHGLVVLAVVLAIVGITSLPRADFIADAELQAPKTLTAAFSLFLVIDSGVLLVTLALWFPYGDVARAEGRLLVATALSMPFLLVRIVYICLTVLGHSPKFQLVGGSPTALLCMVFLMEAAIVISYEACGLTLPRRPSSGSSIGPDTGAGRQCGDESMVLREGSTPEGGRRSDEGFGHKLGRTGKEDHGRTGRRCVDQDSLTSHVTSSPPRPVVERIHGLQRVQQTRSRHDNGSEVLYVSLEVMRCTYVDCMEMHHLPSLRMAGCGSQRGKETRQRTTGVFHLTAKHAQSPSSAHVGHPMLRPPVLRP